MAVVAQTVRLPDRTLVCRRTRATDLRRTSEMMKEVISGALWVFKKLSERYRLNSVAGSADSLLRMS
jgi:hypothetical protein